MKILFLSVLILVIIGLIVSNASADEQIPNWIKKNAGWWATDAISETEFVNAIEFLVNDGIIKVQSQQSTGQSQGVPDWVKNTAGWWATDAISDTEFVNAIEFLVNDGIVQVKNDDLRKLNFCDDKKNSKIILCKTFYDTSYENYDVFPAKGKNIIDEYGFRCNNEHLGLNSDIEECKYPKEKPNDEYRIFLVGGSTMFSSNNDNSQTTSALLEKKILESDIDKKVKVINAGVSGSWSEQEVKLVTEKIVDFKPNLIVVYDGYNDSAYNVDADVWKKRWSEVCDIGKMKGFEVIVLLQPFNFSGYKILTDTERKFIEEDSLNDRLTLYENYRKQLPEIAQNCYGAYDLSDIFDKFEGQIFFDSVHVGVKGDQILADNVFKIVFPIINGEIPNASFNVSNIDKSDLTDTVRKIKDSEYSFEGLNFDSIKMDGLDLSDQTFKNSIFHKSELSNINFKGANLSGAVFTGTTLNNVDFTNVNLENTIFNKVILNSVTFSDSSLDKTSFINVEFFDSKYEKSILKNAEIINSNISFQIEDRLNIENKAEYKPIIERTEYQSISLEKEGFVSPINFVSYLTNNGNIVNQPMQLVLTTIKAHVCLNEYEETREYVECLDYPDEIFTGLPEDLTVNDLPYNVQNNFEERVNESNSVVIFPTISFHAYNYPCIWDYYEQITENCLDVKMNDLDFSKSVTEIWSMETINPFITHNTNKDSYQILKILDYEIISELDIHEFPDILNGYEKVIVLHNKYVTKEIFDAINNHDKVIYLHPGALSEEVKLDLENNSFKVLSPIKFPEERNFQNDFFWEYDNTHREVKHCDALDDPKFEKVGNGIMINCYPEDILETGLLKIVKQY